MIKEKKKSYDRDISINILDFSPDDLISSVFKYLIKLNHLKTSKRKSLVNNSELDQTLVSFLTNYVLEDDHMFDFNVTFSFEKVTVK